MSKPQKESNPELKTSETPKLPRKRGRNRKFSLPKQPALPVKALWDMATPEQRKTAHEASVAIMEYWMGKITKQEVAARLKTPPLRVWQLSQQAISGMVAGLLIQPKTRAPRGAKDQGLVEPETAPENNPRLLRQRIEELEKTISMQERLIAVLREMPGCRDAKIPMETDTETPSQGASDAISAKQAKKATGPTPTGARHEVQPGGGGTRTEDPAKRVRQSS
jgi:hypothetical protein